MDQAKAGTADRQLVTFDDLFDQHYERVLRAMWLVTGDVHEAEDLTQEAFARAYERRNQLSSTGNPVGYVYATALNVHRSRLRRAGVARRRRGSLATEHEDPLKAAEDRDSLRRALAELPRAEREAIVLVAWLEMTSEEAAEILKTSAAAVRTRVSRAKAHLRAGSDSGGLDDE
jgi:RNA polymerase sigma factor (sigma-70 family)